MPVTTVSLKLKFPEFADFDNTALQFAIDEAALEVPDDIEAEWADLALMYKAAHMLTLAKSAAENDGRQIASETFGRISITYVQNASAIKTAADGGQSTLYGDRFDEIMTKNFPTGMDVV